MAIEIKNIKHGFTDEKLNIRVDRVSILGNPYRLYHESERNDVCQRYEAYFQRSIKENPLFRTQIDKLVELYKQHGKLNLYCWCTPKQCHAEIIRDYIYSVINA